MNSKWETWIRQIVNSVLVEHGLVAQSSQPQPVAEPDPPAAEPAPETEVPADEWVVPADLEEPDAQ